MLREVIEAAELADTARLGKEAMAALDELKRKGPGTTRDLMTWGSLGEAAVSFGCLGLAVAGQVEAGIPCVVGGALGTGALRYMGKHELNRAANRLFMSGMFRRKRLAETLTSVSA